MDIQSIVSGMGIPINENSIVACMDNSFIRLNRSNRGPYSRKKIVDVNTDQEVAEIWHTQIRTEITKHEKIRQIVITAERLGPKVNSLSALGLSNGFEVFIAVKNLPQKDFAKVLRLSFSGAVVLSFDELIASL